MRVAIDDRYDLGDRPRSLVLIEDELWALDEGASRVLRFDGVRARALQPRGVVRRTPRSTTSIGFDGRSLVLADSQTRKLLRVDPETGRPVDSIGFDEFKYGEWPDSLRAPGAQVTAMALGPDGIWVAVAAGYSSSIYLLDLDRRAVLRHFYAAGPKPAGLAYHRQTDSLWSMDGANRELRRFTTQGEQVGGVAHFKDVKPRGLAIDAEGSFWAIDQQASQALRFRVEG